jgi:hypothetical protein
MSHATHATVSPYSVQLRRQQCLPACLLRLPTQQQPPAHPHLHDLLADGLILLLVRQLLPRLNQLTLAVLDVLPSLRVARLGRRGHKNEEKKERSQRVEARAQGAGSLGGGQRPRCAKKPAGPPSTASSAL